MGTAVALGGLHRGRARRKRRDASRQRPHLSDRRAAPPRHASFAVPDGARVGIVGRNGAGKTTLFRIIQRRDRARGRRHRLPRGVRIGAVAQEAPGGPEPLIEVVLAADTERAALHGGGRAAPTAVRRAEIETRLVDIGAHSAPARAAAILHGLGFDAAGAGAARARRSPAAGACASRSPRVLFAEPDLLLLDEPTNYLDLEGTLWLYDYLARYPHTVLIVSHDRDLLDTVRRPHPASRPAAS